MSAPIVNIKERDLTTRVKAFDGVYNSILIKAKKGQVGVPTLVSDETDLLRYFTPDETIGVGYDLAYYSALAILQKSNKLWVSRVANSALFGGIKVFKSGATVSYKQINETSPELPALSFSINTISVGNSTINVSNVKKTDNTAVVVDELVGRTISIPGASGAYVVQSVVTSGSFVSDVVLDNPITTTLPTMTGTGTGTVSAVSGVTFDISNVDASTITATVLTAYNIQNGTLSDIAANDKIYTFDGTSYKEFTVSSVDVGNSTVTIDASGESAYITSVTSAKKGYPAATFSVGGAAEGQTDIAISNVVGDPNWLVNRQADIIFDLSDTSTFAQSFTITAYDGAIQKITVDTPINYTANDFVTPITGTSAYLEATATGFDDPTAIVHDTDEVFFITQSDPGEWSKDLRIEIITDPLIVKEPDAFKINVYKKSNVMVPVESFIASRIPGKKDGYGQNIYLDDVLKSSNYIRGYNNPAVDASILPVEIKDKTSLAKMVAGNDGNPVTESDMIAAAGVFENKNNYPLTLFVDGGYASPGFQKEIVRICEARKDCIAILSVPYSAENSSNYLNDIVEYKKNTLNVNSSYAALFTCHVKITDKYNNREIFVSPDGYAAAAINYSYANFEIWYPPAGFKRGNLLVNDTLVKFRDGDMDLLYDSGINPIRFYPGKGIAIWGQKTLSSRPSALDRLNVRLLLVVVQPAIAELLEDFIFELNDETTGKIIEVSISNYLDSVKARKGLTNYKVISDGTNNLPSDIDNHIRNVDVFIKPMQSIEYINFTTILTPTGLSFELAQLAA